MHFIYVPKENKGPPGCNAMFQRIYFGGEVWALSHVLPLRQYFRGVSRLHVPQSKRYQRLLRTIDTYKQNRRKQQQRRGSHWAGAFVDVSKSRWVGMQETQALACEAFSGLSFSWLKEFASVPLFLPEEVCFPKLSGFSFCFFESLATSGLICLQNMPNL